MKTLVIRSFREEAPHWIKLCLASVKNWSQCQGFEYRFINDAIFSLVPQWYLDKTGKGPVAADYARLVTLQSALESGGFECAIWLDADTYVMDQAMELSSDKSCAFGREIWVQEEQGNLRARKNVHNAVCFFKKGCIVLPFLIETVASIIRRADPERIAPQMVGPKLLSALHSLHDFELLPQVGALSQEVARDLIAGGGPAVDMLLKHSTVPLQAINLCASLMDEADGLQVIASLQLLKQAR